TFFGLIAWLLYRLTSTKTSPQTPAPRLPPPPAALSGGGGAPSWLAVVQSIFFWAVGVGMVIYIVGSYLRDHPELAQALKRFGPLRALRRWWMSVRSKLGGWVERINAAGPRAWLNRLARRSSAQAGPFRFFRLGAASPREQILYYYLSL